MWARHSVSSKIQTKQNSSTKRNPKPHASFSPENSNKQKKSHGFVAIRTKINWQWNPSENKNLACATFRTQTIFSYAPLFTHFHEYPSLTDESKNEEHAKYIFEREKAVICVQSSAQKICSAKTHRAVQYFIRFWKSKIFSINISLET